MILLVGGVGFLIAIVAQGWYASKSIGKAMAAHRPLFPAPEGK